MRALILYKVSKRPLANAKPAEKRDTNLQVSQTGFADGQSPFQRGAYLQDCKSRLAERHSASCKEVPFWPSVAVAGLKAKVNGSAKSRYFTRCKSAKRKIWIPSSELLGLHRMDTALLRCNCIDERLHAVKVRLETILMVRVNSGH
jgi:hypothetical protein